MSITARNPLRSQTDLVIATLALMILLLLSLRVEIKHRAPAPALQQISLEGRLAEIQQVRLGATGPSKGGLEKLINGGSRLSSSGWDRAMLSVLVVESGDLTQARGLALDGPPPPGPAGQAFRRCWSAAYLGEGSTPGDSDRAAVGHALRRGYAAQLLEARLLERAGQPGAGLRQGAERWARSRGHWLLGAGLLGLLALIAGLSFAVLLALDWRRPAPETPPIATLPGRSLLLALLGWFLAYLLSGTLVATLLGLLPILRPCSLFLMYGFHAWVGLALLCRLQDLTLKELLGQLFSGSRRTPLIWAPGFLVLAVTVVLLTSLLVSPFLRGQAPPQRELMELVTGASSVWALLPFFLLATVVAPLFEEILFRGTLLPWLGQHLQASMGTRRGFTLALAITALAFGAIHLEPAALPALSALGLVLGLAFLRTSSLATSVVVHGIWNAGVLVFYRVMLT